VYHYSNDRANCGSSTKPITRVCFGSIEFQSPFYAFLTKNSSYPNPKTVVRVRIQTTVAAIINYEHFARQMISNPSTNRFENSSVKSTKKKKPSNKGFFVKPCFQYIPLHNFIFTQISMNNAFGSFGFNFER
jgi:hypothetical protein